MATFALASLKTAMKARVPASVAATAYVTSMSDKVLGIMSLCLELHGASSEVAINIFAKLCH